MKLGLSFLLGFGLIAAICSAIKTVQLTNLSHTDDMTYYIARLSITTTIEAYVILIVGCVPTLRPLVKAIVRKASQRSRSPSSSTRALRYRHEKFATLSSLYSRTISDKSSSGSGGSSSNKTSRRSESIRPPSLVALRFGNHSRAYHESPTASLYDSRRNDAEFFQLSRYCTENQREKDEFSHETPPPRETEPAIKNPARAIMLTTDVHISFEGQENTESSRRNVGFWESY